MTIDNDFWLKKHLFFLNTRYPVSKNTGNVLKIDDDQFLKNELENILGLKEILVFSLK